jgi:hypothetical protein
MLNRFSFMNGSLFSNTTIDEKVRDGLGYAKQHNLPFSENIRLNLFIAYIYVDPDSPEKVKSHLLRDIFVYDLFYFKRTVAGWGDEKAASVKALENIEAFFDKVDFEQPMSFQQHAYYCFCLSAFASGVTLDNLDTAYDRQLKPMVIGTIHPKGKWSIKEEINNQYYCKYLYHVSESGLVDILTVNRSVAFCVQIDNLDRYYTIGFIAAACGKNLEFDGIKTRVAEDAEDAEGDKCTSLCVQRHDYIHRGFAKYAVLNDPNHYYDCIRKLAEINKKIEEDNELYRDKTKFGEVQAAFFMWTHELTTSMFVHGWGRRLPKTHLTLHGEYASAPQMLLRFAAKINFIPKLFSNEIRNEVSVLQSLGVDCNIGEDMTPHEQIKKVMHHLSSGYQYLNEKFSDLYGHQNWFKAFCERVSHTLHPIPETLPLN